MMDEMLSARDGLRVRREKVVSICAGGILEATILIPPVTGPQPPLLAVHGISRNVDELSEAFALAADDSGRVIVVPHFTRAGWPVFQRITRRARPDKALLNLFATLRTLSPDLARPFDLFGFSGGAQLVHRFAMLYPEIVGDIHLGAAGWYTLPDESTAYPYGIQTRADGRQPWARRMRSGLHSFLRRKITVYVGARDRERDEALRCNPELDRQQGRNRVERARYYVSRIREHQAELGLRQTASLIPLPDCSHSFTECVQRGRINLLVCDRR